MSDAALLAALDFDLKCECKGHDQGISGCEPGRPAEYFAHIINCGGPGRHGTNGWHTILVCRGYTIWLRTMTNHTLKCPVCRIDTTIGSLMRAGEPIAPGPKNSLH